MEFRPPNSFGGLFGKTFPFPATSPGCGTQGWSRREIQNPASRLMTWFMASRTDAYVDTSALIAFVDRSDTYHPLFKRLFSAPPALITSGLVVVEGHGWFLRRYDYQRGLQFINLVETLPIAIERFDRSELQRASAFLRKFADQQLTLADAHGLSIMKQRSIRVCWSTDRHLGLSGVPLVLKT